MTMRHEGIPVEADDARQHRDRDVDPAHDGDRLPDERSHHRSARADRSAAASSIARTSSKPSAPCNMPGIPAPMISVGLSNVSNAVPNENRPLINRVYLAMLMGVGLADDDRQPVRQRAE
ncbi:MAG: hypothetical protein MZV64_35170 [Ignavibacteriales bacterium]|nr:hypothetical protein [Ignavibacteriales bacterium]